MLEPTAEVKAVMEKLVAFVRKNGTEFEAKVKDKRGGMFVCMGS